MQHNINFTREKQYALAAAFKRSEGEDFEFEGHSLVHGYAKHLLDYLVTIFGPLPPPGYTEEELERDNPYNQWCYHD